MPLWPAVEHPKIVFWPMWCMNSSSGRKKIVAIKHFEGIAPPFEDNFTTVEVIEINWIGSNFPFRRITVISIYLLSYWYLDCR